MFKLVSKICLLHTKPEEIPYSIPLFLGICCVTFSIIFFLIAVASGAIITGVWKAILLMAIIAIYTVAVLYWRKMPERFVQTGTLLYASTAFIFAVCILPYIGFMIFLPEVANNLIYFSALIFCALLLIIASVWLFLMIAIIYRDALELVTVGGFYIAIGLFLITGLVFAGLNWLL